LCPFGYRGFTKAGKIALACNATKNCQDTIARKESGTNGAANRLAASRGCAVDKKKLRFCRSGRSHAAEFPTTGIISNGIDYFLFFFYNQVIGLSAARTGLALAIALTFDAVANPLVGYLSDNWRSRLGRRLPFMYASILPLTHVLCAGLVSAG
jgi:hypothetical protein